MNVDYSSASILTVYFLYYNLALKSRETTYCFYIFILSIIKTGDFCNNLQKMNTILRNNNKMDSKKKEFIDIIKNYQGILHKVNFIYFKDPLEREDNFQEILYQLWRSYPRLKNRESIGSWIYAVSINTSITRAKKQQKMKFTDQLPEIPDSKDTIDSITKNEELNRLLKAIYRLNDIDKSVMLLYLEEKSYNEISEITGITSSNVAVRINRAKETLKKYLLKK